MGGQHHGGHRGHPSVAVPPALHRAGVDSVRGDPRVRPAGHAVDHHAVSEVATRATGVVLRPARVQARAAHPAAGVRHRGALALAPHPGHQEGDEEDFAQEAKRRVHRHHLHRPVLVTRGLHTAAGVRQQQERRAAGRLPVQPAGKKPQPVAGCRPVQDGSQSRSPAVLRLAQGAGAGVRRGRDGGVDPAGARESHRNRSEAPGRHLAPGHRQRPRAGPRLGRRFRQRPHLRAAHADPGGAPGCAGPMGGQHHAAGPGGAAAEPEKEAQGGRGVRPREEGEAGRRHSWRRRQPRRLLPEADARLRRRKRQRPGRPTDGEEQDTDIPELPGHWCGCTGGAQVPSHAERPAAAVLQRVHQQAPLRHLRRQGFRGAQLRGDAPARAPHRGRRQARAAAGDRGYHPAEYQQLRGRCSDVGEQRGVRRELHAGWHGRRGGGVRRAAPRAAELGGGQAGAHLPGSSRQGDRRARVSDARGW
mmetsp:Transcript_12599/g.56784  ORF Transcript_12599/g.56784 Transcript_12599/m.56784 type:complete len:475 (+) Transcript_12599:301-1725(+)